MHIAMLSDAETQGGAAIAASRLATALLEAGHQVTRVVNQPVGAAQAWQTVPLRPSKPVRALRRLLPERVWERGIKNFSESTLDRLLTKVRPDLINVHNLHGGQWAGWSPELIRVCMSHAPTVWSLHDMWSFTGRCAYNYDCPKFLTGCDATCPTSTEYPALPPDRIFDAWEHRRHLFADLNALVAVAPSRWLVAQALMGMWRGHRVEWIPYGLPLETYRPLNRAEARAALGIQSPGPYLLIAAHGLEDRRKGVGLLMEALASLKQRPITLLVMGGGQSPVEIEGVHLHSLGYLSDDEAKVQAYSAADLLVHPALADNLPLIVMEAIACGTPVAAFPNGGVPDMVHPGQTGWLAEAVSTAALAATLQEALESLTQGNDLRASSRAFAEREYRFGLQAERYELLFRSILEPKPLVELVQS